MGTHRRGQGFRSVSLEYTESWSAHTCENITRTPERTPQNITGLETLPVPICQSKKSPFFLEQWVDAQGVPSH